MVGKIITTIALIGAFTFSHSVLAIEPTAKMLADTCAGCHGPGGASHGPATPSIAGLSLDYFKISMTDFKSGSRASTIMGRIAKGYSDNQIQAMADYYSAKPFAVSRYQTDSVKAALGQKLHAQYCDQCHEQNGTSNSAKGPALAGQIKSYVAMSLEDFITKKRFAPPKMKTKLIDLMEASGQEGVNALVEFYASRKPE